MSSKCVLNDEGGRQRKRNNTKQNKQNVSLKPTAAEERKHGGSCAGDMHVRKVLTDS